MSYVEKSLSPGGQLLYRARLHWIVYLPALIYFVAGISIGFAITNGAGFAIGGVLIALSIFAGILAVIQRWTTELAITSSRIIHKRGLIVRKTIEINRSKVESVQVDQGILGRLLNFGTIAVRGTGGGLEPVKNIDSPIEFRRHIGDVAASKI